MRLRKSDAEIELMQEAANIASDAHKHAMKEACPKIGEWQLQAIIEGYFISNRSNWSYPSIVAGGDNATILHYHANDSEVQDGDLVLIDAGCEVSGYASDITRTFPVNGKFTEAQREIYEIVLSSQKAAIEECIVGNPFDAPHQAAKRVLAEGLVKLGVIPEDIEDATSPEYLGKWYMHNTGHWLGLDVHDVGIYFPGGVDSEPRLLEQGMVLTVEPGLYFGEWRTDVTIPEKYAGIGVRIEDDIVITSGKPLVMTASCPKEIDDIEAIIQS
jgi:Xaa-Pro aminopeptidase